MKKTLLLLFVSLFFAGQILAQEEDSGSERQLNHEIGVNATRLIQQILSFGDTTIASSPYLITYKLMTKHSIGFRAGFGGNYNRKKEKVENFEDSATRTNSDFDWRVGLEWQGAIGKRWKASVGLDFISNSSLSKTVIDTGFDVVTFEDKSFAIGGGPVLGLYFNINDKISLYTETAAYFTNGNISKSQDFKNFPEFNQNSDDITETTFVIHVPTSLYLVFTF